MIWFKYSEVELVHLKQLSDDLRESKKSTVEPLTVQLLEQLVENSLQVIIRQSIDPNWIFDKPMFILCGCLGPQNGELYCSCAMARLRYEYCYDIALAILERERDEKVFDDRVIDGNDVSIY